MTGKNKKGAGKKKTKSKAKKHKKATIHEMPSLVPPIEALASSAPVVPSGFRAVSITQAIMEYAKPILDFVGSDNLEHLEEAIQLALPIWNFELPSRPRGVGPSKSDIVKQIGKILKLNHRESTEFFEMMLERKRNLFPESIQPDDPMTMFLRKEEHFIISEFDYDSLNISDKPYTPNKEDKKLVRMLEKLDTFILEDVDYELWEEHYFETEAKCKKEFEKWLKFKGLTKYAEDFPLKIETYLDFIYRAWHDDIFDLKLVTPTDLEEFFFDFIIRKVMTHPQDYVGWPPAVKFFYFYLYEIGYLQYLQETINIINEMEPHFIDFLRERYS